MAALALMSPPVKSRNRKASPFARDFSRRADISAAADRMLRDMAFVYHLTRSVRNTMLAEKAAGRPALCGAGC
jgi:hypothetical protein